MKTNRIYRFNCIDLWRIGEMESWLGDMALAGLHLRRIGYLCTFERGAPNPTRYRIEIGKEQPDPEQELLYAESGWRLVCRYGHYCIFAAEDSAAPELYTDPTEQGYTVAWLQRQLQGANIALAAALLLFFAMMAAVLTGDRTPALALVEGQRLTQWLLLVVEGYVGYTGLRSALAFRKLRRELASGQPIDHRAPWRRVRLVNGWISGLFLALALVSAALPVYTLLQSAEEPLPESGERPVVQLASVEQEPSLHRPLEGKITGYPENVLRKSWSPAAPEWYLSWERLVPDGAPEEEYSPSLVTRFYRLRVTSLAEPLLNDLIERYFLEQEGLQRRVEPGFDLLYTYEADMPGGCQIYAVRGNCVVMLRYFGRAGLDSLLEAARQGLEAVA